MATRKIPVKPTKAAKRGAVKAQRPLRESTSPQQPSARSLPTRVRAQSLADAGLAASSRNWVKAADLYNDGEPTPFYILGARVQNGQYGEQVVFKVQPEGSEEVVYFSLTYNSQRDEFVTHFRRSNLMLGLCALNVLPLDNGNDYYVIEDYVGEEAPF